MCESVQEPKVCAGARAHTNPHVGDEGYRGAGIRSGSVDNEMGLRGQGGCKEINRLLGPTHATRLGPPLIY